MSNPISISAILNKTPLAGEAAGTYSRAAAENPVPSAPSAPAPDMAGVPADSVENPTTGMVTPDTVTDTIAGIPSSTVPVAATPASITATAGDYIVQYGAIAGIAIVGLIVVGIVVKKIVNRKNNS